ncbi:hypothetical protein HU200_053327 [Digitaria exilis]|uniref:Uncharacterized protein n=1 Tax=Digitaria exilis TaxID=1010633 RepID=A0A835E5A2_9POAL|nr:hypothetical protein HU200_053327 [Digitaria exilis]
MASSSIETVEEGRPVHVIAGNQKLVVGAGEEVPVRVVTANQSLVILVQNRSKDAHPAEHATAREADAKPPPPPAQDWESSKMPPEWGRSPHSPKFQLISPHFPPPYRTRGSNGSSAATIVRIAHNLRHIIWELRIGFPERAVAIGPLHRVPDDVMGAAKRAAVEEFCSVAPQQRDAVHGEMLKLVEKARQCYDADDWAMKSDRCRMDDAAFADMLLLDGCFLLQFMVMVSTWSDEVDGASPESPEPLMARYESEVRRHVDAIAQDVFQLDNQIPWFVLDALIELRRPYAAAVPVDKFLAVMATAFDVGNIVDKSPPPLLAHDHPHLLGLFHRRQVGAAAARNPSRRGVPRLSALSCTAVELAEMGVKITASKTKKFGDMAMSKRRHPVGLFGELSLAPVVLSELTMCWLLHMAAYEDSQGDTLADNFAVGSYINAVSLLVNRPKDVQELRTKGIVVSAFSDERTLDFFKKLAPRIKVGDRYYEIFERLQEYRKERWLWIAVHKFLYNNFKSIVTVLTVTGVLAGLFKTILSLKQPNSPG